MTPEEENLARSVSRSFYTSLHILPASVRPVMSLGYVLCRAADTIADTDAFAPDLRLETLKKFVSAFGGFPVDSKRLEGVLPPGYEGAAASFNAMPHTEQMFLQKVVNGVAQGMMMDLETFGDSVETLRSFRSNQDLEMYLGFIGGDPGRFWTNVLLHQGLFPSRVSRERLFEDGVAFGKGLQMVNILKDLPEDLQRGRCYIPEQRLQEFNLKVEDLLTNEKIDVFLTLYHKLIGETVKRLEYGLAYINLFRWLDLRLRAAVWWPLALGLKTLAQLRTTREILSVQTKRKIERAEVYKTMAGSWILPSEKALRRQFDRLAP